MNGEEGGKLHKKEEAQEGLAGGGGKTRMGGGGGRQSGIKSALPLPSTPHSFFFQRREEHTDEDAGRPVALAGPLRLRRAHPGF